MPTWNHNWKKLGKDDLGQGGEARTFRVLRKNDPKKLAVVKILRTDKRGDPAVRNRFFNESTILKQLDHAGLPKLIETNADQHEMKSVTDLYYVMTFLGGLALNKQIATTQFASDEAISLSIRLLEIVEYLHTTRPSVVHRDIKPQNILLVKKSIPILIDFGAAIRLDSVASGPATLPEMSGNDFLRLPGDKKHPRVDISHTCGVLFFLLTHEQPGDLRSKKTTRPHKKAGLNWITPLSQKDLENFCKIFDKAFAHDEKERFQTAAELKLQLNLIFDCLEKCSPDESLKRSSLSDFAPRPEQTNIDLLENLKLEFLETLNRLAIVCEIADDDLSELSELEIIERSALITSKADGQRLLPADAQTDIRSFLARTEQETNPSEALSAALTFYPAISSYLESRLVGHTHAMQTSELQTKYQTVWDEMQQELVLQDVSSDEIAGYQRYLDTINTGFDTEFRAVKNILYPWVWKFGVCILDSKAPWSAHRLFGIPRGRNGILLMKTKMPERHPDALQNIAEIKRNPLGKWSDLLIVRPVQDSYSVNFLNRAEHHGQTVLYSAFENAVKQEVLPLFGDILCEEMIFQFVDEFASPLATPTTDTLDLQNLLDSIDAKLIPWFSNVMATFTDCLLAVDDKVLRHYLGVGTNNSSSIDWAASSRLHEQTKLQLRTAILNSPTIKLAISSCTTLSVDGRSKIERPYQKFAAAPIWPNIGCDSNMLASNLRTIFEKAPEQYRSFVFGNGFRSLMNSDYINEQVSHVYFLNLNEFIENRGQSYLYGFTVANHDRSLPKAIIEFVSSLPSDESGQLKIRTGNYKILCGPSISATAYMKIFSTHPLRDRIYNMLSEDANRLYKPSPH